MAWENRLMKKLPPLEQGLTDREGAIYEEAKELNAFEENDKGEFADKEEHSAYSMTSTTWEYQRLTNSGIETIVNFGIQPEFVSPTKKDYSKGYWFRYFIKRYDGPAIETSKEQLKNIKGSLETAKELYKTAAIKWHLSPEKLKLPIGGLDASGVLSKLKAIEVGQIAGNISLINERYTKIADKQCPGVIDYIDGRYSEFTVVGDGSVESNLYTSGGEYYKPNGSDYIGYYHIHSEKGPMQGRSHTDDAHDILVHRSNLRSKSIHTSGNNKTSSY
jgi:hypothetical protein